MLTELEIEDETANPSFGEIESLGLLSFPMKGLTLAIDIQNKGNKTLNMLDKLDEIILNNKNFIKFSRGIQATSKYFLSKK